mmetsp:Transcript_3161/g.6390  ORF Transcript_3161/g.6390 Transcript_3161/m.6390 type:complete len:322 (-) Transcript_3161:83-1048(-)
MESISQCHPSLQIPLLFMLVRAPPRQQPRNHHLHPLSSISQKSFLCSARKFGAESLRITAKSTSGGGGDVVFRHDLQSNDLRRSYDKHGWVHIPDFLDAATCHRMLQEANAHFQKDTAFRSHEQHTVYQEETDPNYPALHPRNAQQQSSKTIVDFDRLAPTSPLKQLYGDKALKALIQGIVSPDSELYFSACPYNSAFYNMYEQGDGLGWHFDRGEFGVNLILQNPSQGGTFEYHANTRSEQDEWAFEKVQLLLDGEMEGVEAATEAKMGSLIIFAGRMSMHRVTPVTSSSPRINAILHYEKAPGQRLGAYTLQRFFGREV